MTKTLITALLLAIAMPCMRLQAQQQVDLGLRLGHSSGVHLNLQRDEHLLVGLISLRNDGTQLTGMYGQVRPTGWDNAGNLLYYYGVGAHIGTVRYLTYDEYVVDSQLVRDEDTHRALVLGMDALLGLEYRFGDSPFSMYTDMKPYLDILGPMRREGYKRAVLFDFAIGFKYRIKN